MADDFDQVKSAAAKVAEMASRMIFDSMGNKEALAGLAAAFAGAAGVAARFTGNPKLLPLLVEQMTRKAQLPATQPSAKA